MSVKYSLPAAASQSKVNEVNSKIASSYETVGHNGKSGALTLKRAGNIRILNFDDVILGTETFAINSNFASADRPKTNANGCLYINTNKVCLIWVNAAGVVNVTGGQENNVLNGSLSWTV